METFSGYKGLCSNIHYKMLASLQLQYIILLLFLQKENLVTPEKPVLNEVTVSF